MKLWVVMLIVMLVIIVGGVVLERSVLKETNSFSQKLATVESYVEQNQWSEAEALCRKIGKDWASQTQAWNPFLHNQELDIVSLHLARLLTLLENREKTDALVEISAIKVQVVQLHQEVLTLQNIF